MWCIADDHIIFLQMTPLFYVDDHTSFADDHKLWYCMVQTVLQYKMELFVHLSLGRGSSPCIPPCVAVAAWPVVQAVAALQASTTPTLPVIRRRHLLHLLTLYTCCKESQSSRSPEEMQARDSRSKTFQLKTCQTSFCRAQICQLSL